MDKIKVTQRRHYSAHKMLLRTAEDLLLGKKYEERFCSDGDFIALVMSSLAIESLCNTVGDIIIKDWKDYESNNPKAKIRLICMELKIPYEKDDEPFKGLHWLIRFRNNIAHAKPEPLFDESSISRDEYIELQSTDGVQSKLEKMITIESAENAINSVRKLEEMIADRLPEEKKYLVSSDFLEMSCSSGEWQLTIR